MLTLNRDVYAKSPEQLALRNEGVAKVSDETTPAELETLRFELETFVCEGQYHAGMSKILGAYIGGLNAPEQKAVWISGFYGSGKSHFLKMLRALWTDTPFADGATPRDIAHLPQDVKDQLHELNTAAKRNGSGLHAAAGTLSGGAGDTVRLSVLGILMRSLGLPEGYPQARFELWLRREGKLDAVKAAVKAAGRDWTAELQDMYVSTVLGSALLANVPSLGATEAEIRTLLYTQYPHKDDISNAELLDIIDTALKSKYGSLPLLLLALDEVQQFIGDNADRAIRIQETVEDLSKRLGSRLLVVGSGQSALSGTPTLERLMGRFQVRIALHDTDVTRVVRTVILKKKPEAYARVDKELTHCAGEISRHLKGTKIGHVQDDLAEMVADYPILPVRRRFWNEVLQGIGAGTTAQLRNQLTMIHRAVIDTGGQELGVVVPADFLFDQEATAMLQTAVLLSDSYNRIQELRQQGPVGVLKARICGLVFLISKLPAQGGSDLGVRATPDVLADLLLTDLRAGSAELRKQVDAALAALENDGVLLNIGSEYKLQTPESSAWEHEYRTQVTMLEQGQSQITTYRGQLLRENVNQLGPFKKGIVHGQSKVLREVDLHYSGDKPSMATNRLTVWLRDGWSTTENEVQADARQSGPSSPLVFAYLPKVHADTLRTAIVRWRAADSTLAVRPVPAEPAGKEAQAAMTSRRDDGQREAKRLVLEVLSQARVWVGGGQEVTGDDLAAALEAALKTAVVRLFPRFQEADHGGWGAVVIEAKKGSPAPFDKVGHHGGTETHVVANEMLKYVAPGRKGHEVRQYFQSPPFGWPQDAIDGVLYALASAGHIRATHSATHQAQVLNTVQQTQLTQFTYRTENVVVTTTQKIGLAKLAQDVGAQASQNDAATTARNVLQALRTLAADAGGDAPKPESPSVAKLDELAAHDGNALVAAVVAASEDLRQSFHDWTSRREKIKARWPRWDTLQRLIRVAQGLPELPGVKAQLDAVVAQRLLLQDPDPVPGLCDKLTSALRSALQTAAQSFKAEHDAGLAALQADSAWAQLDHDQKRELLTLHQLLPAAEPKVATEGDILGSLQHWTLGSWHDKRKGLPTGFLAARQEAAKLLEPALVYAKVPSRTVRTEAELDGWLAEVRKDALAKLKSGPVLLH